MTEIIRIQKCPRCGNTLEDGHCSYCNYYAEADSQAGKPDDIKKQEMKNMTESKAIPYNVIVGDKGQKSVNVGIAFYKEDGNVPLSLTLSLTKLRAAIDKKVVTPRREEASKTQYPNAYEGDDTVRLACFKKTKKASI